MFSSRAVIVASISILTGSASADIIEFNFFLSGDQEIPPVDTDAVGVAQMLYDTDTRTFDLDVMVFGIGLDELHEAGPNGTEMHIHNAPAGSNGAIVVDVGFFSDFFEDGLGIRFRLEDQLLGGQPGNIFTDPATNEASLFAGNLYMNIHTMDHPTGELRGQILPAPGAMAILSLGALAAARRRR